MFLRLLIDGELTDQNSTIQSHGSPNVSEYLEHGVKCHVVTNVVSGLFSPRSSREAYMTFLSLSSDRVQLEREAFQ